MASDLPVFIQWEGNIPLDDLSFQLNSVYYELSNQLRKEKKSIWQKVQHNDRNVYDGTVMLLTISYSPLTFYIQPIQYSDFKTVQYGEIPIQNTVFSSSGVFCISYLIFNQSKTHILTGYRNPIGTWGDNKLACPGGILQYNNSLSKFNLSDVLLNELDEEINDSLSYKEFYLSGIIASPYHWFSSLLITTTVPSSIDIDIPINSNYEFTNQQLQWLSVSDIIRMNDDQLFGDLRFIKHRK